MNVFHGCGKIGNLIRSDRRLTVCAIAKTVGNNSVENPVTKFELWKKIHAFFIGTMYPLKLHCLSKRF